MSGVQWMVGKPARIGFRQSLFILVFMIGGFSLTAGVAGCGGGEGGGDSGAGYDTAGATAAVEEGIADLEALLETAPDWAGVPSAPLSDIAETFDRADSLDPTLQAANFWSGAFEFVSFMNDEATVALLAKLGWGDNGTLAAEADDLVERIAASVGGVLGNTANPAEPPLHPWFVPNDPNAATDPNPCIDAASPGTCDSDALAWVPVDVYFIGLPGDHDPAVPLLTFAELYAFWTQTFGDSVRSAVVRLKNVGDDFNTTLMAYRAGDFDPLGADPDPTPIALDKFESDLLQMLYGVFDVLTALPQIWTWGDVDTFMSLNSSRDPRTGAYLPGGEPSESAYAAYFREGTDGLPGNGDEPLHGNPGGVVRLRNALHDLLEAIEGVITRISSADTLSNHVLSKAWLFGDYLEEANVMEYSAAAVTGTLGEFRAALLGPRDVNVYLPVGTVVDFGVCIPGGSGAVDNAVHNDLPTGLETDPVALDAVLGNGFYFMGDATAPADGHLSFAVLAMSTVPYDVQREEFYFAFSLSAPRHVSIWATGDGDTDGAVGYLNSAATPAVVPWDDDANSGFGDHFGLSIDAAYMQDAVMSGIDTAPTVLVVRVSNVSSEDFTLHVQVDLPGAWTAGQPVFLKGGGGRNFTAHTYSIASGRIDLSAALSVLSRIWDRADRGTMTWIPPVGTVEGRYSLMVDYMTLFGEFRSIFPNATFSGPAPATPVDLFDLANVPIAGIDPGFDLYGMTTAQPPQPVAGSGPISFCAYPGNFGRVPMVPGGRMILPFAKVFSGASA